ncbi:MAG: hypothetical protein Q8K93_23405 [Reyranella sp.]|nr:hypothetical protein [Reyranella sp.]
MKKQLVDELVSEAIIDDKRDIQVEFRAKIIDVAVSKQILNFPINGEIVIRLKRTASNEKDNALTIPRKRKGLSGRFFH